ncbi:MAG: hypothetical protein NY202_01225 [Mollicutes bacterium UO1]
MTDIQTILSQKATLEEGERIRLKESLADNQEDFADLINECGEKDNKNLFDRAF